MTQRTPTKNGSNKHNKHSNRNHTSRTLLNSNNNNKTNYTFYCESNANNDNCMEMDYELSDNRNNNKHAYRKKSDNNKNNAPLPTHHYSSNSNDGNNNNSHHGKSGNYYNNKHKQQQKHRKNNNNKNKALTTTSQSQQPTNNTNNINNPSKYYKEEEPESKQNQQSYKEAATSSNHTHYQPNNRSKFDKNYHHKLIRSDWMRLDVVQKRKALIDYKLNQEREWKKELIQTIQLFKNKAENEVLRYLKVIDGKLIMKLNILNVEIVKYDSKWITNWFKLLKKELKLDEIDDYLMAPLINKKRNLMEIEINIHKVDANITNIIKFIKTFIGKFNEKDWDSKKMIGTNAYCRLDDKWYKLESSFTILNYPVILDDMMEDDGEKHIKNWLNNPSLKVSRIINHHNKKALNKIKITTPSWTKQHWIDKYNMIEGLNGNTTISIDGMRYSIKENNGVSNDDGDIFDCSDGTLEKLKIWEEKALNQTTAPSKFYLLDQSTNIKIIKLIWKDELENKEAIIGNKDSSQSLEIADMNQISDDDADIEKNKEKTKQKETTLSAESLVLDPYEAKKDDDENKLNVSNMSLTSNLSDSNGKKSESTPTQNPPFIPTPPPTLSPNLIVNDGILKDNNVLDELKTSTFYMNMKYKAFIFDELDAMDIGYLLKIDFGFKIIHKLLSTKIERLDSKQLPLSFTEIIEDDEIQGVQANYETDYDKCKEYGEIFINTFLKMFEPDAGSDHAIIKINGHDWDLSMDNNGVRKSDFMHNEKSNAKDPRRSIRFPSKTSFRF